MTRINLPKECTVNRSNLKPTEGGYFCGVCSTKVVDYTKMTDDEILAHIQKHGLGCGEFKETQLNRPMKPSRGTWVIALLFSIVFSLTSKGQSVDSSHSKIPEPEDTTTVRRFGTGNISTIKPSSHMVVRYYNRISIFWGLFKFKYPIRKPKNK